MCLAYHTNLRNANEIDWVLGREVQWYNAVKKKNSLTLVASAFA